MNHQGNLDVLINEHSSKKKTPNVIHKTYQKFCTNSKEIEYLISSFQIYITHGKRQTNKTTTFNSLYTFSWISDYFAVIKYRINTPSHV